MQHNLYTSVMKIFKINFKAQFTGKLVKFYNFWVAGDVLGTIKLKLSLPWIQYAVLKSVTLLSVY